MPKNNIYNNVKARRTILVVDDDPDQTLTYKIILEDNGYQVTTFNSPLLALSSYGSGQYDLLLINVKMPVMNGFELYKEIRKIDNKVKICFMTSQINNIELLKKDYSGIEKCCFIQKPIENKELIKKLRGLSYDDISNDIDNNYKHNDNDFSLDPNMSTLKPTVKAISNQDTRIDNCNNGESNSKNGHEVASFNSYQPCKEIIDDFIFQEREGCNHSTNLTLGRSRMPYEDTGNENNEGLSSPTISEPYSNIGALKNEIRKITEMIEFSLVCPEVFENLGIHKTCTGVLLHGPPGTGKTLLAKEIGNKTSIRFFAIDGPEVVSQKNYGEPEAMLRRIFQEAKDSAPSIIFIDEIDAIAAKREANSDTSTISRTASQLLTLMDGIPRGEGNGIVIVIGATNRPNVIDPALRRHGRFDKEIEFKPPDRNGRLEILQIYTKKMKYENDVDLEELADLTHGYVGADLKSLVKDAVMNAFGRNNKKAKIIRSSNLVNQFEQRESLVNTNNIAVRMEDFIHTLKEIKPSSMREITSTEIPKVKWEDIGGLGNIKEELQQGLVWPFKYPELFKAADISPPKGILLYGPPGTGKTLLARAIATEINFNFISIKGPELIGKWIGESEKNIRELFNKAREVSPCIIFFDEFDAVGAQVLDPEIGDSPTMRRMIDQLLTEMDGLDELKNVIVIATANDLSIIDPALLRPGRFDKLLYIQPPDKHAILQILKIHTKRKKLAEDVDLEHISDILSGSVGADIQAMVAEASMLSLKEHLLKYRQNSMEAENIGRLKIHMRHFEQAKERLSLSKRITVNIYR